MDRKVCNGHPHSFQQTYPAAPVMMAFLPSKRPPPDLMLGLMLISLSDLFQTKIQNVRSSASLRSICLGTLWAHTSGGGAQYNAAYHLILVVGLGLVMHVLVQVPIAIIRCTIATVRSLIDF